MCIFFHLSAANSTCVAWWCIGPSAGVGRGGGRRGHLWHHSSQRTHPAPTWCRWELFCLRLHAVPHTEGPQAKSSHSGASCHRIGEPGVPWPRLHANLPLHLQSLYLHKCSHGTPVSKVSTNAHLKSIIAVSEDYRDIELTCTLLSGAIMIKKTLT